MNESFRQDAIDWGIARDGRLFKELDVPLTVVLNAESPRKYGSVCSAFLIEDSVVRNAAGDGLLVSEGAAPLACTNQNGAPNANVFRGNLFKENGGSGMAITAGLDHQLIDNVVSENGLDGILIGAAATGVLTDNRAQRNVDDGFQLDTAALTLTGNVARANGGYGFETNFVGPVLLDGGNTATNNAAGNCNDPGDLPSTSS